MKNICVFLGANAGKNPKFSEAVVALGQALAARKIRLVYGGAARGLMGLLANSTLQAGGEVVGVMARALEKREITHTGLTELHVTETLRERKNLLMSLADGFITLPGGLGTLEEMFEVWNALKTGVSQKPLGLLNTDGYFDGLFAFLQTAADQGFVREDCLSAVVRHSEPLGLLDLFR